MDVAANSPAGEVDLGSEKPFRVGAASVDPSSREAQYPGGSQRIQPQNLKVLILLARHRGQVVSRDRLIECCWGGRFVGDDVINRAISTVRQFAETAGGFRIETIPRAGYRLVESSKPSIARWQLGALALALIAVLALLAFWAGTRPAAGPKDAATPRLALLPFAVAADDPVTRQLALNARDSLADALSQTRFEVSVPDSAGATLGPTDFILSGDVTHASGSVIVTVRIEDAAHHVQVYSERFAAPQAEAAALAERVGPEVTGAIGWTISHLALESAHPSDPAVTALILTEGRLHGIEPRPLSDYRTALQVAKQAPHSALAQMELAFAAGFALAALPLDERAQALAIGRSAARQAVALAPEFGDNYFAWCVLHSTVRRSDCEQRLRKAMSVDPDSSWADWGLATQDHDDGLMDEAAVLARHSLARDPFTPIKIELMLRALDATGQTAEASELYARASRWWPHDGDFYASRVSGMIDRGDYAEIEHLEQHAAPADLPSWYEPLAPLAAALRAHSRPGVESACPVPGADTLKSLFCITALANLGELDGAFGIADARYPARVGRNEAEEDRIFLARPFVNGTEYITGPSGAALRRDPRYLELAQRVGLLAYWRSGRLPDFCKSPAPEPICVKIARR